MVTLEISRHTMRAIQSTVALVGRHMRNTSRLEHRVLPNRYKQIANCLYTRYLPLESRCKTALKRLVSLMSNRNILPKNSFGSVPEVMISDEHIEKV